MTKDSLVRLRWWHFTSAIFQFAIFLGYLFKFIYFDNFPKITGDDSNKTKNIAWVSSTWECEDQGPDLKDWRICPEMPNKWDTWPFKDVAMPLLMIGTFATFMNHLILFFKTYPGKKNDEPCIVSFIRKWLCFCISESETLKDFLHDGVKYEYWIEYAISAPPITVVVYYFSGVVEARTLLIVLVAQCYLMAIGLGIDFVRINQNDKFPLVMIMWFLFVVGFANFSTIWVPLLYTMFENINELKDNMGGVIALICIEFLLFFAFGAVQAYYTWRIYGDKPGCCCNTKSTSKVAPADSSTTTVNTIYMKIQALGNEAGKNEMEFESQTNKLNAYLNEHYCHLALSFFSKASLAILYLLFI